MGSKRKEATKVLSHVVNGGFFVACCFLYFPSYVLDESQEMGNVDLCPSDPENKIERLRNAVKI